jgi:hypothetical protein
MESKKCTKCNKVKSVVDFYKMKGGKFGVMGFCKTCLKERQENNKERRKSYRDVNKDKTAARNKEYYQTNKERLKEKHKERYKTDHLYALQGSLRSRTIMSFKRHGYKKNSKTAEMLGCDWETLKKHIEKQFDHRMNWDNRGRYGWHIDHILPLSGVKTEKELIELCHYTNLQPLWWSDNLEKGDKIIQGTQTKIRI